MRKRMFLLCLTHAGLTQKDWAKKHGISNAVVSMVLNGRAKSLRVTTLAEAFVAEQLPKLAKEVTEAA